MFRIFRHYVPRTLVMLGLTEALILFVSTYLGASFQLGATLYYEQGQLPLWTQAVVFAGAIVLGMTAMGLYHRDQGTQPRAIMLRLVLSFVCGFVLMGIVYLAVPQLVIGGAVFATALVCSFVGIASCRLLCAAAEEVDQGRRVLVLGTGERARQIDNLRRSSDQVAAIIVGFVDLGSDEHLVSEERIVTLGMRGMVQNALTLDGAQVPDSRRLGDVGGGMRVAQDAMLHGRLGIAAAAIGGIKRCLQLTLRYGGRRTVVSGRLLDNPALAARLTATSLALPGLERLVDVIARRLDAGSGVPADAFVACKTLAPEWLWRAADDLVQLLGGRGYIETNIAAQLLRDARVTRILEGPTEALLMHLGSRWLNDRVELNNFMTDALDATAICARLALAAHEIETRCWVCSAWSESTRVRRAQLLCGQVVSDGVLYAACVASGDAQAAEWAAGYFEHSLASAIGEASGVLLAGPALEQRVADYALRIGDIEQQLAGADEMLDPLIARTAPRLRAESLPNATATVAQPRASTAPVARAGPRSRAELENFVLDWLASELKLARTSINAQASFFDYGLDSVTAVLLAVAIEERFGCEVEPESLYQRPQIDAFLADLARSA